MPPNIPQNQTTTCIMSAACFSFTKPFINVLLDLFSSVGYLYLKTFHLKWIISDQWNPGYDCIKLSTVAKHLFNFKRVSSLFFSWHYCIYVFIYIFKEIEINSAYYLFVIYSYTFPEKKLIKKNMLIWMPDQWHVCKKKRTNIRAISSSSTSKPTVFMCSLKNLWMIVAMLLTLLFYYIIH